MNSLPVSLRNLLIAVSVACFAATAHAVPSFARQTGEPCSACHTSYPELTDFGRQFKLNGYTMSDLQQLKANSSKSAPGVSMNVLPNLSVVLQAGETHMNKAPDGVASTNANFPKEFGLYYAGRMAPNLGAFLQLTYNSEGSMAVDMSDVRATTQGKFLGKNTIYGLDFNNGPTFEDVWNSTPGYGWPYVENDASVTADGPFMASDAVLTQVLGMGGYMYWDNSLYGYVGVYQSAIQGATPPDSTVGHIVGGAPYYRLAWTPTAHWMIGTFGFLPKYLPDSAVTGNNSVNGPTQNIRDLGVDTQYQLFSSNNNAYTVLASYISEHRDNLKQTVDPTLQKDSISTHYGMLMASWMHAHHYGASLGAFATGGDKSMYYNAANPAPGDGTGYRANTKPDTRGGIAEVDFLPQQNIRLSLQYTMYSKFHGYSSNYDGNGRSASDNNTVLVNALVGF